MVKTLLIILGLLFMVKCSPPCVKSHGGPTNACTLDSECCSGICCNSVCSSCCGSGTCDSTGHANGPNKICNVQSCYDAICLIDKFCCKYWWDWICVNEACGSSGLGNWFPQFGICNNFQGACGGDLNCCSDIGDRCRDGHDCCGGTNGDLQCSVSDPPYGFCCVKNNHQGCTQSSDCCSSDAICDSNGICKPKCIRTHGGQTNQCTSDEQCCTGQCCNGICASCCHHTQCDKTGPTNQCDIAACKNNVCNVDSWCCNVWWDAICVNEACGSQPKLPWFPDFGLCLNEAGSCEGVINCCSGSGERCEHQNDCCGGAPGNLLCKNIPSEHWGVCCVKMNKEGCNTHNDCCAPTARCDNGICSTSCSI